MPGWKVEISQTHVSLTYFVQQSILVHGFEIQTIQRMVNGDSDEAKISV